jgi:hypothetical protein
MTPLEDCLARALVGLPNIDDGVSSLQELDRLSKIPDDRDPDPEVGWISELRLAEQPDYDSLPREEMWLCLVWVENRVMPGLVRQWMESECSQSGAVGYRILSAGRKVLRRPPVLPEQVPRPVEGASETYAGKVKAARSEIRQRGRAAYCRELGGLPLPG